MSQIKIKKFTTVITPEDYLDVILYFDNNEVIKFALNYRAVIDGKWHAIYRVDNFHGFLHEQRFWRTKEPIPLEQGNKSSKIIIKEFTDKIMLNFMKYKKYFRQSIGETK